MFDHTSYKGAEIVVGIIVLLAIVYLIYIAIGLATRNLPGRGVYVLYADFVSASGLHTGDPVKIAGVKVGTVGSISLADYQARVALKIQEDIAIRRGAVASLERQWLIGDGSVSIEPGSAKKFLGPGDEIEQTESPPSLQQLVGKLLAGDLTSAE